MSILVSSQINTYNNSTENIQLSYRVPNDVKSNTLKIIFTNLNTSNLSRTIYVRDPVIFDDDVKFPIRCENLGISESAVSNVTPNEILHDGEYTLSIEYISHTTETLQQYTWSSNTIIVDTITSIPILNLPTNNATYGGIHFLYRVPVSYILPENPLPGSVKITFSKANSDQYVIFTLTTIVAGSDYFSFTPGSIENSDKYTISGNSNNLEEGEYKVTLSYQDAVGHTLNTADNSPTIFIDLTTNVPILIQPVSNQTYSSKTITIEFNIPEQSNPNSLKLTFAPIIENQQNRGGGSGGSGGNGGNGGGNEEVKNIIFSFISVESGIRSLSFNADSPSNDDFTVVNDPINDGKYNVTVEYRDLYSNPLTSKTATNVIVDTKTLSPILLSDTIQENEIFTGVYPFEEEDFKNIKEMKISYILPENPLLNSARIEFLPINPENHEEAQNTPVILTLLATTSGSFSFSFNVGAIKQSQDFSSKFTTTSTQLKTGKYKMILSYQDSLGHDVENAVYSPTIQIKILDISRRPIIKSPISNSLKYYNELLIHFIIPSSKYNDNILISFY